MLVQYSRKNDRTPIGVLVADKVGEKVVIGWAACDKKDYFSKSFGVKIAINRKNLGTSGKTLPHHLQKILPPFLERCSKYFKVGPDALEVAGNC